MTKCCNWQESQLVFDRYSLFEGINKQFEITVIIYFIGNLLENVIYTSDKLFGAV